MNESRNPKSAYTGLISILAVYFLLIILVLVFASRILLEVSSGSTLSNLSFIPLALVLPLFLITTIIFNLSRLIRQKKKGHPGSNLKTKLLIFFTLITILSSVPQGILAVNFINTILKSWFSSGIEPALKGGLDIAMEYNRSSMENIATIRDSLVFENILLDAESSPNNMWRNIKGAFPVIDSISLYNEEKELLLFRGNDIDRDKINLVNLENGTVSRSKEGSRSIIRTRRDFFQNGILIISVLTIELPQNFDQNARQITNALQLFTQNREFQTKFLLALILFYAYFSLPIILLTILTSFLLSEEIIRPIAHLQEAIKKVVAGDYSYRILTNSKDDLSALVNSFNYMVSELELSRTHLMHSEKITAWQEIAQRMAHEIKNPLTPIKLSAQRILRKYKTDPDSIASILEPAVDAIIHEVENLTKLLSQFKDFARMPSPKMEEIQLKELITEITSLYAESYPKIDLRMEELDDVQLRGDKGQIQRVFSNLLSNSFEAITGSGSVTLRTELVRKGNSHYCRILITDTGSGVDPGLRKQIFNPYFTTKEDGTGLGLSIVERIISDHGGKIWFETEKNVGTTFFIELAMGNTG